MNQENSEDWKTFLDAIKREKLSNNNLKYR